MKPRLLLPLAFSLFAAVPAAAATINFGMTDGLVSSLTLENLEFAAAQDYNAGSFQLRIVDLYPETQGMAMTQFEAAGMSVDISGLAQTVAAPFGITAQNTGMGGAGVEALFWYSFESTISVETGDAITLAGSAATTTHGSEPLPLPASGTYTAYLVSSSDGALLSGPLEVQVDVVPEPSAPLLASLAAAVLLVRRRRF